MAGGGAKKGERRGGRQKGTQNKISVEVKKALEKAFDELGGSNYLIEVGQNDPRTFCTLLGKILPTTIEGDPENPIGIWWSGVPRAADKKR
jgi:hypothetical protein